MLNSENYILFASRNYTTKCVNINDFYYDLNNRIKYIQKLLLKYNETNEIKDIEIRKILNQFISFYNAFYPEAATELIYFLISDDIKPTVETFLYFLSYIEKPKRLNEEIYNKLEEL